MDLLAKYSQEIQEDTKIDQINILEKQLMLPALKHKWVARLIEQKRNKSNLEKKRKDLKEEVLKKLKEEGIPEGIPKLSLNSKVESSETIKKIDEEIQQVEFIIEYLEKIEKIMSSITFDLGNATKIMMMETT